jgi:intracellular sulfur oxidation DsrE/DsrF family protein
MSNTLSVTALVLAIFALVLSALAYFQQPSLSSPSAATGPSHETVELAALTEIESPGSGALENTDAREEASITHKVVYHADFADLRRFSSMLASINNMIMTYQNDFEDYDVRIVFNAYGIRFVTDDMLEGTPFAKDTQLTEQLAELRDRLKSLNTIQNVKLELCDITREAIDLAPEDLFPGVELVTSGVVRIAELQAEGFTYIKVE